MTSYILFSGGRESLLNLHKECLLELGSIVLIHFNYGQKSFENEQKALRYYVDLYSKNFPSRISAIMKKVSLVVPEGISTASNESNHVAARNLVFLSYTINLVYTGQPIRILFGATKDILNYTDGTSYFLRDFRALTKKLYPKIDVISHTATTFTEHSMRSIVNKGLDFSHLWLCDDSIEIGKMCGKCHKCTVTLELLRKHTPATYKKVKHLWNI